MICWLCYLTIHREEDAYLPTGIAVRKELRYRQCEKVYLELTYRGFFSDELRRYYDDDPAFDMASLGRLAPDIMGLAEIDDGYTGRERIKIVIEVKRTRIFNTTGILQALKYGIHFGADIAMLVSPQGVTENLLEYLRLNPEMLSYGTHGKVILGCLDAKSRTITTWAPRLQI